MTQIVVDTENGESLEVIVKKPGGTEERHVFGPDGHCRVGQAGGVGFSNGCETVFRWDLQGDALVRVGPPSVYRQSDMTGTETI